MNEADELSLREQYEELLEQHRGVLEDLRAQYRDLREQFRDCSSSSFALRERCTDLRVRALSFVEQGGGLTQRELVELYARIDALVPRRVRVAEPKEAS